MCSVVCSIHVIVHHSTGRFVSFVMFREVKFAIVIGSTSTSSTTCRRSSYTGNSVLLQYSTDGSITWKTIATYSQNTYTARVVTATIPRGARTTHTRFRWIQPYNQGNNLNQWAIDGISMREAVITYNIYSDFSTGKFFVRNTCIVTAVITKRVGLATFVFSSSMVKSLQLHMPPR